jgi:hypothetical protein
MREFTLFKRWLIVFALVLAQIPFSVLASQFQKAPKCSMPCCAPQVSQPSLKETCLHCTSQANQYCQSSKNQSTHSHTSIQTADSCPCKIAPTPSPAEKTNVALISISTQKPLSTTACLLPTRFSCHFESLTMVTSGIASPGSGPPKSGLHRDCCGRAPPHNS